jgi:hypothetical protein
MPFPTSAPDLIALCALAIAGLILGALGLLLGGARKRPALRAVQLAAVLAAGGAAAWVAGLPTYVWLPCAGLSAVWAIFALCRSPLPERICRAALARPRVQAGLLMSASAGLLGWQVYCLDREVNEAPQMNLGLEGFTHPPLVETGRAVLTDTGRAIPLFAPDFQGDPRSAEAEADFLSRGLYLRKLIQTGPAEPSHNCHGWVFAAGRGWIRGGAVEQILKDNAYRPVERPAPGDIAVFRDVGGEVMHTALVRSISDGVVLLESKWGPLGRYIHTEAEHAYKQHRCTWYNTPRGSHLLRGLDEKTTPANGTGHVNPAAEPRGH